MENSLALDLKVARRKAGLTQSDLAHLLEIKKSRVSKIERGMKQYRFREIVALSLIYDRSLYQLAEPL